MRKEAGFTVAEILVVMGLLGVLLVGLIRVEAAFISSSTTIVAESSTIQELTDAISYLGDTARRAAWVQTTGTVAGNTCSITATAPCFFMVAPDPVDPTASLVDRYTYFVFRVERRTTQAVRTANAWADENTWAVNQYTATACSNAVPGTPGIPLCEGTPPVTSTIASTSEANLVVDGLVLSGPSGAVPLFAYDAAQRRLTMRLQAAYRDGGRARFVPATTPLSTSVIIRNL